MGAAHAASLLRMKECTAGTEGGVDSPLGHSFHEVGKQVEGPHRGKLLLHLLGFSTFNFLKDMFFHVCLLFVHFRSFFAQFSAKTIVFPGPIDFQMIVFVCGMLSGLASQVPCRQHVTSWFCLTQGLVGLFACGAALSLFRYLCLSPQLPFSQLLSLNLSKCSVLYYFCTFATQIIFTLTLKKAQDEIGLLKEKLNSKEEEMRLLREEHSLLQNSKEAEMGPLREEHSLLQSQYDSQTEQLENLKAELQSKEKEMRLLREKHNLLQSQYDSQTEQLENLKAELQSKEAEMGPLREEHSLLQSQYDSQTEQLENLKAELQSKEKEMRLLREKHNLLQSQYDSQTEQLENLKAELQSKEAEMGPLREEHSLLQSQYDSQTEQLENLKAELQSKEKEMRPLREKHSLLQSQYDSQTEQLENLKAELQSKEKEMGPLREKHSLLQSQYDSQTEQLENLKAELQSKEKEMRLLREKHSLLQSQYDSQTEQLENLEAELQSKEKEMGPLREKHSLLQSQYDSQTARLKNLKAELQSKEKEMGPLREKHSLLQSQYDSQTEQLENLEAELQSKECVSGESQDAGSLLSDAQAETSQRSERVQNFCKGFFPLFEKQQNKIREEIQRLCIEIFNANDNADTPGIGTLLRLISDEKGHDVRIFKELLTWIESKMMSVTQCFNKNVCKTLSKKEEGEWQSILSKMVKDIENSLKTVLLKFCLKFFDNEAKILRNALIVLLREERKRFEETLLMSKHLQSHIADITHPLTESNEMFLSHLRQCLSLEELEGEVSVIRESLGPQEVGSNVEEEEGSFLRTMKGQLFSPEGEASCGDRSPDVNSIVSPRLNRTTSSGEEDTLPFSLQEKLNQANEKHLEKAAQLIDRYSIPRSIKDEIMKILHQSSAQSMEDMAKEWQYLSIDSFLCLLHMFQNMPDEQASLDRCENPLEEGIEALVEKQKTTLCTLLARMCVLNKEQLYSRITEDIIHVVQNVFTEFNAVSKRALTTLHSLDDLNKRSKTLCEKNIFRIAEENTAMLMEHVERLLSISSQGGGQTDTPPSLSLANHH